MSVIVKSTECIEDVSVYGLQDWLRRPTQVELEFVPLPLAFFNMNPFNALRRAGIREYEPLMKLSECVVTGLQHHVFAPSVLLVPDLVALGMYAREVSEWKRPQAMDPDWLRILSDLPENNPTDVDCDFMSNVERGMLGSGYGYCNMPHDGDAVIEWFTVALSDGCFVLGMGWNWYNK